VVQKRLLVFPMGEKLEQCQYVWGDGLHQLLDNSTTRLGLQKPAKFVFTLDGKLVRVDETHYYCWRRGVVVSGVRRMNEVNARRARLVPGWVTVFGQVYHLGM